MSAAPLPAALVPLRCKNPDCTLPQQGGCARQAEFSQPLSNCPDLLRQAERAAGAGPSDPNQGRREEPEEKNPDADGGAAPWSGRSLMSEDVADMLWRRPARLLAIAGPIDAGKTSLLVSFFLQLSAGQCKDLPYRFASSKSLLELQQLMKRVEDGLRQRTPSGGSGTLLDHTPLDGDEEDPSRFIHLGLRPRNEEDDRHIDLLISDMSGELFTQYGEVAEDGENERLSILRRCDGFLVMVDAGKLVSPEWRKAEADLSDLITRLVDLKRGGAHLQTVGLVFSKFDQVIDQVMPPQPPARLARDHWGILKRCNRLWQQLEAAAAVGLDVGVFPVAAFPLHPTERQPIGVESVLCHFLNRVDRRRLQRVVEPPVPVGASPFETMRRWKEVS